MTDQLPPDLAEHFEDPCCFGELSRCTHVAELEHDLCPDGADLLVIQMRVSEGRAEEIWRASGSPHPSFVGPKLRVRAE